MLPLPIHPALVHFPLAMLTAAWVSLVLLHGTQRLRWDDRVRLFETIGVATLPIVIVAGFIDANDASLFTSPRWDLPLVWHALISTVAAIVWTGHWWWRRERGSAVLAGRATAAVDVGLATVGVWLLLVTGLIAGEMVYGA